MLAFEPINNFTVSRILFKPHLNALYWGHRCPWTLSPSNSMEVSYMQSDDRIFFGGCVVVSSVPGRSSGLGFESCFSNEGVNASKTNFGQ